MGHIHGHYYRYGSSDVHDLQLLEHLGVGQALLEGLQQGLEGAAQHDRVERQLAQLRLQQAVDGGGKDGAGPGM